MAMLQARPRHLLSWSFELRDGDQTIVGMDVSWLREGGCLQWDGADYRLSREGLWSGDFLLSTADRVLARATKPSALLRRFDVHVDGRTLRLQAVSPFTRRFHLIEDDVVVGDVTPDNPFVRGCTIVFPDDLGVPVKVFLFWLVVLMWRRAANANAAN